jgi:hypothetical protein
LGVLEGVQTTSTGGEVSSQGPQKHFIKRTAEDPFKDFDEIGK